MHNTPKCTNDHQVDIEWTSTGITASWKYIYTIARSADSDDGDDAYMGRCRNDGAMSIYKNVSGTRTAIADGSPGATPLCVHSLKVEGTQITCYAPVGKSISISNSDIVNGLYCGFGLQYVSGSSGSLKCDNLAADDV